ncbi:MAG: hypothetical protein HYZ28_00580 [Myxococcales bacterium]|nr:hypothetical protein [Myxococcales bacterium]
MRDPDGGRAVRRARVSSLAAVALALVHATAGEAASYHVSTGGSDGNDGSLSAPWATFARAMSALRPGDVLLIEDGTYLQTLDVTISGSQGNPVTIRARNDGKVTVDGEGSRPPCRIAGTPSSPLTDVVLEGVVCRNGMDYVVSVQDTSRATLRRVSAYEASAFDAGSSNALVIRVLRSPEATLEDVAAAGQGLALILIGESPRAVVRRCWVRWERWWGGGYADGLLIQGTDDGLVENCISQLHPAAEVSNVTQIGVTVLSPSWNPGCNRNRLLGNVAQGAWRIGFLIGSERASIAGNRLADNVTIGAGIGVYQRADSELRVTALTAVDSVTHYRCDQSPAPKDPGFSVKATVRNSAFIDGGYGFVLSADPSVSMDHDHNSFEAVGTPWLGTDAGTSERFLTAGFEVSRYGRGGYLFVPEGSALRGAGEAGSDIGADVRFRYENGEKTNVPLWPWPMESRIFAETGASVTWESDGGLWRSLEGIYPDSGTEPDAGEDAGVADAAVGQPRRRGAIGWSCGCQVSSSGAATVAVWLLVLVAGALGLSPYSSRRLSSSGSLTGGRQAKPRQR